ncbi:MAG: DUF2924 domain-containing protein [Dehalococcoidia bacterium]|nr:DUF2924 domain-containing protein [Dehalococcoidia bacterium]
MLLIDSVKYEEWKPATEDEFEQVVKEHAKDIFGEDSIYFDIKQRIRSKAGIGSIPDGYALTFGDTPCWYIVEVELSSHPLYEHIVPQMTKFSRAINDLNAQRAIVAAMYSEIKGDVFKQTLVQNRIGDQEIHAFLSRLIFNPPILVVVIEKRTKELEEVCSSLPLKTRTVELRTFTREDVGIAVHAHLFEPLYKLSQSSTAKLVTTGEGGKIELTKRVALQDLIDAKLVNSGQKVFRNYKGNRYEAEITAPNKLMLLHDNTTWNSLSEVARHVTGTAINGWIWWYTLKDGQECLMDDLRKKLH